MQDQQPNKQPKNIRGRGGRPKGSPNKLTADVKAAILAALEKAGGVNYLAKVANKNPAAFCALLGRVVPMQVDGTVTHHYVARLPTPVTDMAQWQQQNKALLQ